MPLDPTILVRKPTVLVVDDEESLRLYLRRVLEQDGYNVLTAHNGAHALSILRQSDMPVQLVITDVAMPGMGGRELAAHIALEPCPPPVLFMSAGHQHSDLPGPLLSKPFRAHQVGELARLILHGRAASSSPGRIFDRHPLEVHRCA